MLLTPPLPKKDINYFCGVFFFPPPNHPAAPKQLFLLLCSKLSWRIRSCIQQMIRRAKLAKEEAEKKRQE